MKKRVLTFFLVLAMVFSACPVQVLAQNTETIVPGDEKNVTMSANQETTYTFVPAETAEYTFWNVGNNNAYYCWLYEDGKVLTNGNAHFAFDAKAGSVYEFTVINQNDADTAFELHLEKNVPANSVKMRSNHVVLLKGERRSFPLTFDPVNAIRGGYSWTLSDPNVATIASQFNSGCDVIGNAAGTTTLTVNVGGVQASCEITVMDADSMEKLNPGDHHVLNLESGDVQWYHFEAAEAGEYTFWDGSRDWLSYDSRITCWEITQYGMSKIFEGNGIIPVNADAGATYIFSVTTGWSAPYTCNIHLEKNVPAESVYLPMDTYTLRAGSSDYTPVSPQFVPTNSFRGGMKWEVADSDVVRILRSHQNACEILPGQVGTTTLTGTIGDKTVSCQVHVVAQEEFAAGEVKNVTLAADQEITYTFVPAETAEYTFWNVGNSNSYYCWLYEDGKVLTNGNAHFAFDAKAGSVYEFTVINQNDADTAFELHLEKNVPANSVKMRSNQVVMLKGERRSFPLTFDPVNAIRGEYSWSLSDTNVATIASHFNSGCDVIGNAAGTTTLTVNVGGVQASCEITVMDADSMEELNPGEVKTLELDPGEVRIFRFAPTKTAQYTLWNEFGFNGYFFTIYEGNRVINNGNCPVAFQAQNGTAYTIHVRNEGPETATYEMHLEENVPMISVSLVAERKVPKGGSGFVALNYNPFNSVRGDVQWSVDDTSVVKLGNYFDGGCNFEAVGIGTATITAVAGGQSVSCKVTVSCGHENVSNDVCQDCGIRTGVCGDDLRWILNDEGELIIWGTGPMTEYAYYAVPWYLYRNDIKTVIVEDGVESISAFAFLECQKVTEVILPNSVTSIGMSAFRRCNGLKTVDLPDNLTEIASNLFSACDGLESIEIPSDVAVIGESAFNGCVKLKSIVIPAAVTSLEKWALSACIGMTEMEFLGNAPAITEDAFTYINATATYPAGDPSWTSDKLQGYGGTIEWRVQATGGDANGDGMIDTTDALQMLWYALNAEAYPLDGNGDVTGDGEVTVEDAVYVVWYTLFPDMYVMN